MLFTRIVTALVLLAVLLPAMFLAPAWVWGLVSLLFLVQGALEWGRLLGSARAAGWLAAGLAGFGLSWLCLRSLAPVSFEPLTSTVLCGVAVASWLLFMPSVLRAVRPMGPKWWLAAISLAACWLALFELCERSPFLLLSAMALVWIADIGAYAGGRLLGRRKLAPRVSPGKTWEGALTGWLAVCGLAFGATFVLPSEWPIWSTTLLNTLGWFFGLVVLTGFIGLSITGDLFESALKRAAGIKDSSQILPGHGGVLDRIDALIPTMPLALLLLRLLP